MHPVLFPRLLSKLRIQSKYAVNAVSCLSKLGANAPGLFFWGKKAVMARSEGRSNDFTKEKVFPIGNTRKIGYNKIKTIIVLDKGGRPREHSLR